MPVRDGVFWLFCSQKKPENSVPIWSANKKNEFDVEKYLNHNLTFSKDTEFEMFRIDITEDEIRQIEIIN